MNKDKSMVSLECPICHFRRLIDTRKGCKSELKGMRDFPENWVPDYYQKCPSCKQEIGIRKVS